MYVIFQNDTVGFVFDLNDTTDKNWSNKGKKLVIMKGEKGGRHASCPAKSPRRTEGKNEEIEM